MESADGFAERPVAASKAISNVCVGGGGGLAVHHFPVDDVRQARIIRA